MSARHANVFYSWQSDLPNAVARTFVQGCIEKALKELDSEGEWRPKVVLADRRDERAKALLRLDQSTANTSGAVDIAETIRRKIRESDVLVADISTISGRTRKYRRVPNPNVVFELGYAWAELGPERVVLVYNAHFGGEFDIPFDLRGKKFFRYDLGSDATQSIRQEQRKSLIVRLKNEIKAILIEDSPRPRNLGRRSEGEIRYAHDRGEAIRLFQSLNLPILENHIRQSPDYYSYSIASLRDEFTGTYHRAGFHVFDEKFRDLLERFDKSWSTAMPGDSVNYYRGTTDLCTERYMSEREAALLKVSAAADRERERLTRGRDELSSALRNLLEYVRYRFPDVAIESLGSDVGKEIAHQMRVSRGQAEP